ncbi:DNA-protecting protein DprA [Chitinimonas arctica]|uniref:DNA-protecting protein DprA n=1 Tax=Chitinimonas arctica TaxID=2594795 RepID=A0A516SMB7_9NEIS|nr:DNA-protecting protein DprA [Chitinimonas arctica]
MGPSHAIRLLTAFGSPDRILSASTAALARHLPPKLTHALEQGPPASMLAHAHAWLAQPGNHLLTLADTDYPAQLLQIADPPPLLYAKGHTALLNRSILAVVGSRNATPQGLRNAEAFARDLSQRGWCIVSGLALGIDTAAHRGGLAGRGATIAVVGTGLDIVYPASNHALAHRIAAEGLMLSEFPLGTPGRPGNFPRRNRLISGLARGVLVVEAALQSGSLITAREAAEQGREVFAIPGSIHSPLAKGCHQLLKQGAKLVEQAVDILEELGESPTVTSPARCAAQANLPDTAQASLLAALGHDPLDIDTLTARAGLTPEQVYAMLLSLEMMGQVAKLPGGRYQRLV